MPNRFICGDYQSIFIIHLQLVLENSRFVIWMMKLTNFCVRRAIGRTA